MRTQLHRNNPDRELFLRSTLEGPGSMQPGTLSETLGYGRLSELHSALALVKTTHMSDSPVTQIGVRSGLWTLEEDCHGLSP